MPASMYPLTTALVMALVLAIFIRRTLLFTTEVVSISMANTLAPGERLLTTGRPGRIRRGDIIVFDSEEMKQVLIKRVVGLPGERLHLTEQGELFVDGERVEEAYATYARGPEMTFQIPKGHYFVMGDNRPFSRDSRSFMQPFIAQEHIRGKVLFRH